MRQLFVIFIAVLVWTGSNAQEKVQHFVESLPELSGVYENGVEDDWLVENVAVKSGVFRRADNSEIVVSNGIISRTIKVSPNAATVSLKNLQTGQEYLRGVKPEAIVEIDGINYHVGGLDGQKNYAFLTTEDKDGLQRTPNSFQISGMEVGSPKPTMEWYRIRHHAPDAVWPPKGVRLKMDYSFPEMETDFLLKNSRESGLGRKTILEENFTSKVDGWKIYVSSSHKRSSIGNEGKPGEIYTPANSAVYMEKKLQEKIGIVEAAFLAGTDKSSEYGPGIVLIFKDRSVKFNLNPGGDTIRSTPLLRVYDGNRVYDRDRDIRSVGSRLKFDFDNPYILRIRLEGNAIFFEGREAEGDWTIFYKSEKDQSWGNPVAVRVGKTDEEGEGKDGDNPGELVRLHILGIGVYGEYDKGEVEKLKAYADNLQNVTVSVNYELYDGVPVFRKWISVANNTAQSIKINSFVSEILAAVEYTSFVDYRNKMIPNPNIHVETDYAFGGMSLLNSTAHSVKWMSDEQYVTQVN